MERMYLDYEDSKILDGDLKFRSERSEREGMSNAIDLEIIRAGGVHGLERYMALKRSTQRKTSN